MANFNLNLQTATDFNNKSVAFQQGSTGTITYGSLNKPTYTPKNLSFSLGSSSPFSSPRRPGGGQLYPRGNQ